MATALKNLWATVFPSRPAAPASPEPAATSTAKPEAANVQAPRPSFPSYEASLPPLHIVLLGAGQRGQALLASLLHGCRGNPPFICIMVADQVPHAAKSVAKEIRTHAFIALTGQSKLLSDDTPQLENVAVEHYELVTDQDLEQTFSLPQSILEGPLGRVAWNKWCMVTARNDLHKPYCLAALRAGFNVFCEKPLATTLPDCTAILQAAVKGHPEVLAPVPRPLFISGFVLRHAEMYIRIHELLSQGFCGRVISCEFNELLGREHGAYIFRNWRRNVALAGPNVLEKTCHDLDVIHWLLSAAHQAQQLPSNDSALAESGILPVRVAAFGGTNIFTKENASVAKRIIEEAGQVIPYAAETVFRTWPSHGGIENPFEGDGSGDIEDHVIAMIEYSNGARVNFHLNSFSALLQRRLMICGLEGTIEADLHTGLIRHQRISHSDDNDCPEIQCIREGQHGGGDRFMLQELWTDMVATARAAQDAAAGASANPVRTSTTSATIKDMYISAATALAIDQARREGRVVQLDSELWNVLERDDDISMR